MTDTRSEATSEELQMHLDAIALLEDQLRQDPEGFAETEALVNHCHALRNIATTVTLRDAISRDAIARHRISAHS